MTNRRRWLVVATALLVIIGGVASAAPVAAAPLPEATTTTTFDPIQDALYPERSNNSPGFFDIGGQVRQAIDDWITSLVTSAINPALELVGKTLLSAPDITTNPGVHAVWLVTLGIANSLFVLLVIVGGIVVMTHETVQTRYSIKEIAPRLVVAVLAANCSALIASQAIAFSNALAQGILGDGIDPTQAVGGLGRAVISNSGSGGFLIILAAAATVLCVLLGCLYLLRAMLVVLLVAAAPLMLACHALPQTERLAHLWWRASAACLGVQVGQALVLIVAVRVFFAPDGSNVLGLSATNGLVELLIMLCLFWIMLRMPAWAGRLVLSGGVSVHAAREKSAIATVVKVAARVAK